MDTDTSEPPHLLSVEDNPDTRMLIKHLLDRDYNLSFATDAEEALGVLGPGGHVDLLLVDINLGSGKSGTALLHEIGGREDVGDVPTIALTAYAMPGDREDLLEEGFDEYVGKPFTRDELIGTIEEVLAAD